MSLSLSHLLAAFSVSIFYCLLYSVRCPSCYAFFVFSLCGCVVFLNLFPESLISVSDPDWIRIQLGQWIQEVKNDPQK
jgi:hypothetical protein